MGSTVKKCDFCGKEITNPRNNKYCSNVCAGRGATRGRVMKARGITKEEFALLKFPPKEPVTYGGIESNKVYKKRKGKKPFTDKQKKRYKDINNNPINVRVNYRKPPKRINLSVDYDFLKYIYIIFRWVRENYRDLSRREFEIILLLYTEGAFGKGTFSMYWKPLGMRSRYTLERLVKNGWINLYREWRPRHKALYILSTKAKDLCSRVHRISLGLDTISTNPKYNRMADKKIKQPKANDYFLDLIKEMNKKKR